MEKYRVQLTKAAYRHLKEIRTYIEFDLLAPDAAKHVLSAIRQKVKSLEELPHRFSFAEPLKWKDKGIRSVPVKNYIVYYWIDENKRMVQVIAVLYMRRDQTAQVKKALSEYDEDGHN